MVPKARRFLQVNQLYQALNGHISLEEVKLLKALLAE